MIVRDVHGRPPTPWCDASNIVRCTRGAGAADASSTADQRKALSARVFRRPSTRYQCAEAFPGLL